MKSITKPCLQQTWHQLLLEQVELYPTVKKKPWGMSGAESHTLHTLHDAWHINRHCPESHMLNLYRIMLDLYRIECRRLLRLRGFILGNGTRLKNHKNVSFFPYTFFVPTNAYPKYSHFSSSFSHLTARSVKASTEKRTRQMIVYDSLAQSIAEVGRTASCRITLRIRITQHYKKRELFSYIDFVFLMF